MDVGVIGVSVRWCGVYVWHSRWMDVCGYVCGLVGGCARRRERMREAELVFFAYDGNARKVWLKGAVSVVYHTCMHTPVHTHASMKYMHACVLGECFLPFVIKSEQL